MSKKMEYSIIDNTDDTFWRLEIQYTESRIDQIHPTWLRNRNGRIPLTYSFESPDYQEVINMANRMKTVYSPDEWKYVIGIVSKKIHYSIQNL